jgi:hypothetical protein
VSINKGITDHGEWPSCLLYATISASDEDKCAISRIGSLSTNSMSWGKQNVIVLNTVPLNYYKYSLIFSYSLYVKDKELASIESLSN